MTKKRMWKQIEEIEDAKSKVKWYGRGKIIGEKIRFMMIDQMQHMTAFERDDSLSNEDLIEMASEIEWNHFHNDRPVGEMQFDAYQTGIFHTLYKTGVLE